MHRTYATLGVKAKFQQVRLGQDVDYIMRLIWDLQEVNTQHHDRDLGILVQTSN